MRRGPPISFEPLKGHEMELCLCNPLWYVVLLRRRSHCRHIREVGVFSRLLSHRLSEKRMA